MSDQIIDNYLRELRVSAWVRHLPRSETAALESATREKIDAELDAAGNRDESTVYGVLDRMGPAADIVGRDDATSPTGWRSTYSKVLEPVARVQFMLDGRGWGLAEIGGLLLLMVGPFLLWWIGPAFGILLIRYAGNRWSGHAELVATKIVFGLLAVQAIAALALLTYVMFTSGIDAEWTRRLMSDLTPLQLLQGGPSGDISLYVLRLVGAFLAPIAGIASGIYLIASPRVRR
jgi:hypothetical protein